MGTLLLVIAVIGVLLIIAAMRKPTTAVEARPSRMMSFSTPASRSEVTRSVVRFAQNSGYAIEEISSNEDRIVVSEPPTLTTWGFFYPVYLSQQPDGGTKVEIGVKSKLVQYGPLTDRSHERFVNEIKATIYSEGYRTPQGEAQGQPSARPLPRWHETADRYEARRRVHPKEEIGCSEGAGVNNPGSRKEAVGLPRSLPAAGEGILERTRQRYCTNCGTRARTGDRFCAACGHELVPTDIDAEARGENGH
ncbi:MAG: zinc-ribbon domain-containing protein [Actinomycetota bacterium]|nr:zinc-ribbon domain-containing protein [Actinomycetota bacterium]